MGVPQNRTPSFAPQNSDPKNRTHPKNPTPKNEAKRSETILGKADRTEITEACIKSACTALLVAFLSAALVFLSCSY